MTSSKALLPVLMLLMLTNTRDAQSGSQQVLSTPPATPIKPMGSVTGASTNGHLVRVDPTSPPWSAVAKLYNGTRKYCSAVAIDADEVVTAAHCLYDPAGNLLPADALHVLFGYKVHDEITSSKYTIHARVASY